MGMLLVVLGVLALLGGVVAFQFNRMATLRNRCAESWSNVDTELLRRHDLVPNLVAAASGYAAHEKATLAALAQARSAAALARTAGAAERAPAEARLSGAIAGVLALAEAYPQLRASELFLKVQTELGLTEDRIQAARRFYNANVRDYDNQIQTVPGVWLAGWFRMRPRAFFELDAAAYRQVPEVHL